MISRYIANRFFDDDLFLLPRTSSWTWKGNWYNPETHDVVPKKDYIDAEVKRVDEEISTLQKEKDRLLSLKGKTG